MRDESRLLTWTEIAVHCGVCEASIRNWVRRYGFPELRRGGRRWYDPVQVDAWLEKRRKLAEAAGLRLPGSK